MPDIWSLRLLAQEIAFKRAPVTRAEPDPASWLGDLAPGGIIAAAIAALLLIRLLIGSLAPNQGGGFSIFGDFGDDGGDGGGGD